MPRDATEVVQQNDRREKARRNEKEPEHSEAPSHACGLSPLRWLQRFDTIREIEPQCALAPKL